MQLKTTIQQILLGNTISEDIPKNEIAGDIKKEENKTNTSTNKKTSKDNTPTYHIKVNYGAQVVTIYKKDESGNYTVPVKAMVCSTGEATPTSGVYKIPARWEWCRLQGYVWGHYTTQIKGNILFHSVPYLRQGELDSLEYWEYDKLGTAASAGCVRLTVQDAKWIYDNCKNGTQVEFYSSSNPGPLGKPSAKKISSYEDYLRNWDPTDPNSNNPWKNYKAPQKTDTNITPKPNTDDKPTNNDNKTDETNKNEITSGGSTISKPTNTTGGTEGKNEISKPTNTTGGTTNKNEISKPTNTATSTDKKTEDTQQT